MATISNSYLQWHGPGSGYGAENAPRIYLAYDVTSGEISGEGDSRTISLTYTVSLRGLSGSSTFGFPIRVFTSPPEDPNNYSGSLLYKNSSPNQWSDYAYGGSRTVDVRISDVSSDGSYTANLYIATYQNGTTVKEGCGCGEYAAKGQSPTRLGLIQLFNSGAPEAPATCSVNKTEVLVGSSFTCTYSGNRCQYRTRNSSGVWGSWTDWSESSGSTFTPASDYTVSAVQMRTYTVDQTYMTPESDFTESSIVYLKLPVPSQPTVSPNPVNFGSSVTATSAHANSDTSVNYVWYDSTNSSVGTGRSFSPRTPGHYCKSYATRDNFVQSDYSSASAVIEVKLNAPSSLTLMQVPMYNMPLSSFTKSMSAATTNPTDVTVVWQYSVNNSTWSAWSDAHKVTSSYIYVRARYTKTGFVDSDWISGTSGNTKLNKPTSLSVSPDPVTTDLSVTASVIVDSGATANYTWYKSNGSKISGQTGRTYTTSHADGTGIYAKVQATRAGFVSSDISDASNSVDVYFEPRNMESSGFRVTFNVTNLVIPGTNLFSSWNDFKPSLNLGRFNYYVLEILSNSNGSWRSSGSVSGSNTPTSTSVTSSTITVSATLAGLTCKLRLSCYYKIGETVVGPQETALFESAEFLVGGYPNQPEFLYPGVRDFKTCNLSPRIIFKISNPDMLPDKTIYDIRIVVKTNSGSTTYTFKNNSDMFLNKDGQITASALSSGQVISFKLPQSTEVRTIQVYCRNAYLETVNPEVVVSTFVVTNYPVKGSVLSNRGHREAVHSTAREVLDGYKKINGGYSLDSLETSSYPPVVKSFCIPILSLLKSTYESVLMYAPRQSTDLDIGSINTSADRPPIVTDSENFGITLGNFFSDIYYILKNML